VDENGNSVSAHNGLAGGHHRLLHTAVARCLARLVASSGLAHNVECNNLFAGLVYEEYLAAYANTIAGQNAVGSIPDFVVHDYPDLGSGANDVGMGMAAKKTAVFKIE
jgi:hypothetical protein